MDHVEADDGRGGAYRPRLLGHIKAQRRPNIRLTFCGYPMSNRLERFLVAFARLPCEIRHLPAEMGNMLPGATANLKHDSPVRQYLLQDACNGAFVALCRGTDKPASSKTAQRFTAHLVRFLQPGGA
jgi:hypothetical protein